MSGDKVPVAYPTGVDSGDLTAPVVGTPAPQRQGNQAAGGAVDGNRPPAAAGRRPRYTTKFCRICNARDRMHIDGRCCAEWSH